MSINQQAKNEAKQKEGMTTDPKWTTEEKEKYTAAYNAEKKKQNENKD